MTTTILTNETRTVSLFSESSSVKTVFSEGTSSVVTNTQRGPQGAEGASVAALEPRIEALEEETDGLVSGASPLDYYILAKGT